jgi:hypothetical protein
VTLERIREAVNEFQALPEIEIWVHAASGSSAVKEASTADWRRYG